MLEEVDNSQANIGEHFQEFLTQAYLIFFKEDSQKKVLENLARSMSIFIYKFKKNVQEYASYLEHFQSKNEELTLNRRKWLLEAVVSGQLWINAQ